MKKVVVEEEWNITYPNKWYKFEKDMARTRIIDINKITKRLIYGDAEYGRVERSLGGYRAFNGNPTDGAIPKLESGWIDNSVDLWRQYYNRTGDKTSNEYKLLVNHLKGKNEYKAEYKNGLDALRFYVLPILRQEGYSEPSTLLVHLLIECLDDKFGVNVKSVSKEVIQNEVFQV